MATDIGATLASRDERCDWPWVNYLPRMAAAELYRGVYILVAVILIWLLARQLVRMGIRMLQSSSADTLNLARRDTARVCAIVSITN
jgi:hypothetical protein